MRTPQRKGGWGGKDDPVLLAEVIFTVSNEHTPVRPGLATIKLLKSNLVIGNSQYKQ